MPKSLVNHVCVSCHFTTFVIRDYDRHVLTAKHLKNVNVESGLCKNQQFTLYNCGCGRQYTARNSLWYHKKKCSGINYFDVFDGGTSPNNTISDTSNCDEMNSRVAIANVSSMVNEDIDVFEEKICNMSANMKNIVHSTNQVATTHIDNMTESINILVKTIYKQQDFLMKLHNKQNELMAMNVCMYKDKPISSKK